jgi:hypothetical protein
MNLFLDIWKDSLDGRSARRKATTYTGQHNTEKRGHTSMPGAGFERTIPEFERLKTGRDLDRATTGNGVKNIYKDYLYRTSVLYVGISEFESQPRDRVYTE